MKIIVQRVDRASVSVDGEEIASIHTGFLLYTCLEVGDTAEIVKQAAYKVANLRIFEDKETRKMGHNLSQAKGEILNISQFTLSWDGAKGHRPSFDKSMPPSEAKVLLRVFNNELSENYQLVVKEGRFAADMKIDSINDGPVTFFLSF